MFTRLWARYGGPRIGERIAQKAELIFAELKKNHQRTFINFPQVCEINFLIFAVSKIHHYR